MSFVSYEFIGFLALLLLLYYLLPKRFQWGLLLLSSLFFYACSGLKNLIFIVTTVFSTWFAAIMIEKVWAKQDDWIAGHKELKREEKKAYKASMTRKAKLWLVLCLLLNLGILALIKYADFVLENINNIFGTGFKYFEFILPLGISFYMFQSLGYVIDV